MLPTNHGFDEFFGNLNSRAKKGEYCVGMTMSI